MKLTSLLLLAAGAHRAAAVRAAGSGSSSSAASSLRNGRAAVGPCPGGGTCSGHGECETQYGICWCDTGFGGEDCLNEVPLYMDITKVGPPELQDMAGRYKLQPMYLMETVNNSNIKFIAYSPLSSGWAISRLYSDCPDDVCFFAYGTQKSFPPKKGYVYGGPMYHAYYQDLVFDDAETNTAAKPGYHINVKYRQDPQAESDLIGLDEFNTRYVLQPRYVHETTGKYSMYPVDFLQHRTWVVTGLLGEPRKERIVMTALDPSRNRYTPPAGPWEPAEYGMEVVNVCANHVGDVACQHLQPKCEMTDGDTLWIQQCCRWTCGQCQIPRSACTLPHTNNITVLLDIAKSL